MSIITKLGESLKINDQYILSYPRCAIIETWLFLLVLIVLVLILLGF